MKEEYSRNPAPKLLRDIQEAKKHISQLQGQLTKTTQVSHSFSTVLMICLHTGMFWSNLGRYYLLTDCKNVFQDGLYMGDSEDGGVVDSDQANSDGFWNSVSPGRVSFWEYVIFLLTIIH